MINTNTNQRILVYTCFISVFCGFWTIWLATNGSFDLFQPSFLWKAYNHYFLSLLDGRLDVPVEGIGKEGSFINGKVFMYYGLLPTAPRFLLYPFVDLTKVPAGYFSILLFTFIGNIALQYSIVNQFFANTNPKVNSKLQKNVFQVLLLIIITLIIWFGSASFLISQNATIYHEPYAAALCITNVYLALLIRHGFFLGRYRHINLLPYAFLAGLCVHARMPTALSLYLVTGLIMLVQIYRSNLHSSSSSNLFTIIIPGLIKFWKEILVLGLFGISILLLNYFRYGDLFNFMGVNNGFIFFEGWSERQCSVIPHGTFYKFTRIIVNAYVYLSGDWQNHWSLMRLFSTGYGRVELPAVPVILLWGAPVVCLMIVLSKSLIGFRRIFNRILMVFILAFSAGALFQLSYPTIAHRYIAELWLPLGASLFFCWYGYIARPAQFNLGQQSNKIAGLVAFVGVIGVSYQLYLGSTNEYYLDDGPVTATNKPTFHYSDEDHAYLSSLTTVKIAEFHAERIKKRAAECDKYTTH